MDTTLIIIVMMVCYALGGYFAYRYGRQRGYTVGYGVALLQVVKSMNEAFDEMRKQGIITLDPSKIPADGKLGDVENVTMVDVTGKDKVH